MTLAVANEPAIAAENLSALRENLLLAAVRYVRNGRDGSRGDRLRTASDLSGIPRTIIESNLERNCP